MDNSEKLHIRLHVYDQDIPVNVARSEEYLYREAARLVTGALNAYHDQYDGRKTEKDILYMALIDVALRYQKAYQSQNVAPYEDVLTKVTAEIESVLGKKV